MYYVIMVQMYYKVTANDGNVNLQSITRTTPVMTDSITKTNGYHFETLGGTS